MRLPVRRKAIGRVPARAIPSFSALVMATLASNAVLGLEESRLWLPRAQSELRPLLVQAAQLAENSEGCEEVISGEQDTERSTDSAPVFRVVCRNPAGYTYSVFVTNAGKPNAKVEKVQSAVGTNADKSSSASSPGRPAAIDDKTASQRCLTALKLRTDRMADANLQESELQRLQSATGVQYVLDFDASDPSGLALRFHAICRVSAGGTALIEIKPRKADAPSLPRKPAVTGDSGTANSVLTDDAKSDGGNAPAPASENGKAEKPESTGSKSTDDDGWEVVE